MTVEQQAREMLDRIGDPNSEHYPSGNLVELANLINEHEIVRAERDKLLILDAEHTRREIGLRNELEALQQEKDSLLTELGALRAKEPPLLQCVECKNTESCAGAMARQWNHGRCMYCGNYFKVVRA